MIASSSAYRQARASLQDLEQAWVVGRSANTAILETFYELEARLKPASRVVEVDPALAIQAENILAQCAAFHTQRQQLAADCFATLTLGLRAIGTFFGKQMASNISGSVRDRFFRAYVQANDYRLRHLDGKGMPADPITGELRVDPDGPLFLALAKAAGYRKPMLLWTDINNKQFC